MIVKEILLNALANAGHIHDGDSSDADELELALRLFNTEMRFYSDRNLITAYQSVVDIPSAIKEQVVGKYNVKKGMRVYEMTEKPNPDNYVHGRDFVRIGDTTFGLFGNPVPGIIKVKAKNNGATSFAVTEDTIFKVQSISGEDYIASEAYNDLPISIAAGEEAEMTLLGQAADIDAGTPVSVIGNDRIKCVVTEGFKVKYHWEPSRTNPYEYVPDVVCSNMERIVTVMYRDSMGKYNKLRFVPLSQFYTENDDYIYCTSAAGENKVKVIVPDYIEGRPLKVVYNTNMSFQKNDRLELPDNHIALVELAVTVALLRKDADSDPTRLNNYKEQLKEVEDNIEANTITERRIMRTNNGESMNSLLRSGSFIRRRLR